MKFKPELPEVRPDPQALEQDYAQSRNLGKVQLGKRWLFFRKFSGAAYLPYDQVVRAWLRQEEVKARLCCGTANFDQFYLVLECADGQQRRGQVIDKKSGQVCLDHIQARNPAVKIGYVKPQEQSLTPKEE